MLKTHFLSHISNDPGSIILCDYVSYFLTSTKKMAATVEKY